MLNEHRKNSAEFFWCSSMCACSTPDVAQQLKHFILVMWNENSFYASLAATQYNQECQEYCEDFNPTMLCRAVETNFPRKQAAIQSQIKKYE